MGLPHTPKTDWAAADGVTEANLNQIGGNINYLDRKVWISGSIIPDVYTVNNGQVRVYTSVIVLVPPLQQVVLQYLSFYNGDIVTGPPPLANYTDNTRIEIAPNNTPGGTDLYDLATYEGSYDGVDVGEKTHVFAKNSSASITHTCALTAMLRNNTGSAYTILMNGFFAAISVEDI